MFSATPRRNTTCVFEVLMAGLLIDLGLRFAFSENMPEVSNMRTILTATSTNILVFICLFVGIIRGTVMLFEHQLGTKGLPLRIASTILAGLIWLVLMSGFLEAYVANVLPLPPGFDMLATQIIGELYVAYKLATEISRKIDNSQRTTVRG